MIKHKIPIFYDRDVKLCIPLVAHNREEFEEQLKLSQLKEPDFIEFRRDYLTDTQEENKINKALREFREGDTGVIYTFRDSREGGITEASGEDRYEVIKNAADADAFDYVDIEIQTDPELIRRVEHLSKVKNFRLIKSFHSFEEMPDKDTLFSLLESNASNCDVLKVAVTPKDLDELKELWEFGDELVDRIPDKAFIIIGMGKIGEVTRLMPEKFGGSLSFCSNGPKSAPGQVDIEEVREFRKNNRLDEKI